MILSFPVKPRASLTALMHASVPELTNLTLSTFGASSTTNSAIFVSSSVGMPYDVPL